MQHLFYNMNVACRYLDELKHSDGRPLWPSPAYPGLMGNVLPEFLSFSGHPFPKPPTSPDQPFPDLIQTHAYLRKFAESLFTTGKIRLHTEVVGVDQIGPDGGWKVAMKDWSDQGKGREFEEIWDAVVIATAWYDNPKWPETEGLEEVRKKGIAKHAKVWEGPDEFKGKVCLAFLPELSMISIMS
jgi:cation diffusion facilitator CzcD-associated flavoprotein CzcO